MKMAVLIACLSTGKGSWGHVSRLIEGSEWEKVILLTNQFGKENFSNTKNVELEVFDFMKGLEDLRDEIYERLKKKNLEGDVAINFISGEGKEHMALMAAILKLGIGIRFYALTKDGVKEI